MIKISKLILIFSSLLLLSVLNGCWFDKETTKMRGLEKKIKQGSEIFRDYRSLGEIYYKKERYEDTIKCMTALLEKYNNSECFTQNVFRYDSDIAYRHRGKALYLLGRKEDAAKDFSKSDSESGCYWDIGRLYFKKQQYDEVVYCMNKILEKSKNKNWHGAYTFRGKAFYFLGNKKAAVKDLVEAGGRGMSDAVAFMKQNGIEWGGKEKERYDRMVSNASSYNTRSGKNFKGRDEVFNTLRDDINNSNMSWSDKQKAKVKLHDDMYKE